MRTNTGGAKVLTAVEGIYKDGEVELSERPEVLLRRESLSRSSP